MIPPDDIKRAYNITSMSESKSSQNKGVKGGVYSRDVVRHPTKEMLQCEYKEYLQEKKPVPVPRFTEWMNDMVSRGWKNRDGSYTEVGFVRAQGIREEFKLLNGEGVDLTVSVPDLRSEQVLRNYGPKCKQQSDVEASTAASSLAHSRDSISIDKIRIDTEMKSEEEDGDILYVTPQNRRTRSRTALQSPRMNRKSFTKVRRIIDPSTGLVSILSGSDSESSVSSNERLSATKLRKKQRRKEKQKKNRLERKNTPHLLSIAERQEEFLKRESEREESRHRKKVVAESASMAREVAEEQFERVNTRNFEHKIRHVFARPEIPSEAGIDNVLWPARIMSIGDDGEPVRVVQPWVLMAEHAPRCDYIEIDDNTRYVCARQCALTWIFKFQRGVEDEKKARPARCKVYSRRAGEDPRPLPASMTKAAASFFQQVWGPEVPEYLRFEEPARDHVSFEQAAKAWSCVEPVNHGRRLQIPSGLEGSDAQDWLSAMTSVYPIPIEWFENLKYAVSVNVWESKSPVEDYIASAFLKSDLHEPEIRREQDAFSRRILQGRRGVGLGSESLTPIIKKVMMVLTGKTGLRGGSKSESVSDLLAKLLSDSKFADEVQGTLDAIAAGGAAVASGAILDKTLKGIIDDPSAIAGAVGGGPNGDGEEDTSRMGPDEFDAYLAGLGKGQTAGFNPLVPQPDKDPDGFDKPYVPPPIIRGPVYPDTPGDPRKGTPTPTKPETGPEKKEKEKKEDGPKIPVDITYKPRPGRDRDPADPDPDPEAPGGAASGRPGLLPGLSVERYRPDIAVGVGLYPLQPQDVDGFNEALGIKRALPSEVPEVLTGGLTNDVVAAYMAWCNWDDISFFARKAEESYANSTLWKCVLRSAPAISVGRTNQVASTILHCDTESEYNFLDAGKVFTAWGENVQNQVAQYSMSVDLDDALAVYAQGRTAFYGQRTRVVNPVNMVDLGEWMAADGRQQSIRLQSNVAMALKFADLSYWLTPPVSHGCTRFVTSRTGGAGAGWYPSIGYAGVPVIEAKAMTFSAFLGVCNGRINMPAGWEAYKFGDEIAVVPYGGKNFSVMNDSAFTLYTALYMCYPMRGGTPRGQYTNADGTMSGVQDLRKNDLGSETGPTEKILYVDCDARSRTSIGYFEHFGLGYPIAGDAVASLGDIRLSLEGEMDALWNRTSPPLAELITVSTYIKEFITKLDWQRAFVLCALHNVMIDEGIVVGRDPAGNVIKGCSTFSTQWCAPPTTEWNIGLTKNCFMTTPTMTFTHIHIPIMDQITNTFAVAGLMIPNQKPAPSHPNLDKIKSRYIGVYAALNFQYKAWELNFPCTTWFGEEALLNASWRTRQREAWNMWANAILKAPFGGEQACGMELVAIPPYYVSSGSKPAANTLTDNRRAMCLYPYWGAMFAMGGKIGSTANWSKVEVPAGYQNRLANLDSQFWEAIGISSVIAEDSATQYIWKRMQSLMNFFDSLPTVGAKPPTSLWVDNTNKSGGAAKYYGWQHVMLSTDLLEEWTGQAQVCQVLPLGDATVRTYWESPGDALMGKNDLTMVLEKAVLNGTGVAMVTNWVGGNPTYFVSNSGIINNDFAEGTYGRVRDPLLYTRARLNL
jgi:hypothetical protein